MPKFTVSFTANLVWWSTTARGFQAIDDDHGEPLVQRAWRHLKTLVASPTPETAMVSR